MKKNNTETDKTDEITKDFCITQIASTILELLGCGYEGLKKSAASPLTPLLSDDLFSDGRKCDRVFMYNPDAIAWWIYEKDNAWFEKIDSPVDYEDNAAVKKVTGLKMCSVFPPKTPVCFASMYSGLLPEEHGITKYEKPVLTVPTVFDALPAAGKKAAIVSTAGDSISLIFQNRPIDYFIYRTKNECNEKALELIRKDVYDVIVLYNGNYDYWMHRVTPTGFMARKALRENIQTFCTIQHEIAKEWNKHRTALAFAPDHGCHAKLGIPPGDHGKMTASDMNIKHWWYFL